ncbi:MAG: DCC1-like thiol-disulfide oxidoreductase family protein [bacterium]|nr:DCC1-like thiol-disulfide oxidoreductase family protein [bacterium]
MKRIIAYLDRFFFEEVSATGFGLMRAAWAFTVLFYMLGSAGDVVRYYSDAGILPQELGYLVFRTEYRFTLLQYITDPSAVIALWSVFMFCLFFMMIGLWPKLMTIVSVLLLFSFHERNLQPLGGGDTVLRIVGFVLIIAPEVGAFSISRLKDQWSHWKKTGTYLRPLKTHIWPYRILLWQILIIYVTSGWDKLQGTMWMGGTVVEAVFHHTHFVKWPKEIMDGWTWFSPYACFYTLIFEFGWLFMLVPRDMWYVLPMWIRKHSIKRWLIAGSLGFHWGIFVFMDVGSFPLAMSTAYLGLLLDQDWDTFTRMANKRWKGKIVILYDGMCGLCRRSIFMVQLMDVLNRTKPVDFRDGILRSKHAPDITEADLDRAMHIKTPKGKYYKGFYAFRKLSWHMPSLRILTPLMYLPGVAPVGCMIYTKIAASRNRCAHGACKIDLTR